MALHGFKPQCYITVLYYTQNQSPILAELFSPVTYLFCFTGLPLSFDK